jgi:hypothetical protein
VNHARYRDQVEQVVLQSLAPTLLLPHAAGRSLIGENVMIAWDGSHGAARAVVGALPLLQRAGRVHLVRCETDAEVDRGVDKSGFDLPREWLGRHSTACPRRNGTTPTAPPHRRCRRRRPSDAGNVDRVRAPSSPCIAVGPSTRHWPCTGRGWGNSSCGCRDVRSAHGRLERAGRRVASPADLAKSDHGLSMELSRNKSEPSVGTAATSTLDLSQGLLDVPFLDLAQGAPP